MGFIYKLTFESGKSYIGKTEAKSIAVRFSTHLKAVIKGSKCAVHCAWRKYGTPTIKILGRFSGGDLNIAEKLLIAKYNTLVPNGYNMTTGGEISPTSIPAIAAKVSKALMNNKNGIGNKNSLGKRFKMSKEQAAKRDATWTKERRKKQSERMQGNKFYQKVKR